jgi:hypothetical protein
VSGFNGPTGALSQIIHCAEYEVSVPETTTAPERTLICVWVRRLAIPFWKRGFSDGPVSIVEVVYLRRDRRCRRILVVALRNAAIDTLRHGDTITLAPAN